MQKMVEDGLIGTIIVKDLSRFGREQVEMGRLTQIVYPSLGVTFILLNYFAIGPRHLCRLLFVLFGKNP